MLVELIALNPVLDIFDYLPSYGIAAICLSSPINLLHSQCTLYLQPRIHIQAHGQMTHSMDSSQSQIIGHGMGEV